MVQQPGVLKISHKIEDIPLRSLAYLGDAIYELFIRKKLIFLIPKSDTLHKITTSFVKSEFHSTLLDELIPFFTEEELKIIKRARNIKVSSAKRKDQAIHRISTSFEAIIGYLYLNDNERLEQLFVLIEKYIDKQLEDLD